MDRKHSTGRAYNPETLALGFGYDPALSEGAVKPPVFLTSTFQFENAQAGKEFFELAYGLREKRPGEEPGLIYSRLNNPNLQMFEARLAAWDLTERGATFASGMAAIATTCLALLRPGDRILTSAPIYGGTHFLFHHVLPELDIRAIPVPAGVDTPTRMREIAQETPGVRMLYLETPANPSNAMVDIAAVAELGRELTEREGRHVVTAVDNTFLGPVFQRPAPLGADLVIYSATKFIGGHSDLIAGVVTGPEDLMQQILGYRTILGTMTNPFTGWLLLRSLETLSIRMRRQAKNAKALAQLLVDHPRVRSVHYPTLWAPDSPEAALFRQQCTGPGSLIAFEIEGGEKEAFEVLDRFEVFKLAVSLGGTESLVEHPMSMTHADVPPAELETYGVSSGLIRVSVGIEHLSDLQRDLLHALG